MSFFDLTGTGELHCDNTGRVVEVQLAIQAVNGRTRIHCSPISSDKPFELEMLSIGADSLALKNIKIESAAGILSAKHLANVNLNYLSSYNENEPLLITQLAHKPGKRHTLTLEAGYLTFPSSNLAFDFEQSDPMNGCQLMFIGAAQSIKAFKTSLALGSQIVKIQSYGQTHPSLAGIIVVNAKDEIFSKDEETLRLALALYLRQKISFLAKLSEKRAVLNLIDHSTVSYGALNRNPSSSLIQIKAFIEAKPESRTYLRFLIELAGNSGVIDDRLLNGFIALEALFPNRTLQADKLSKRLKVSQATADFFVQIRHKIFHYGVGIRGALDILQEEKQQHSQCKITPMLQALSHRQDASWIIYSSFTDLMYTHFAELVGIDAATIKRWSDVNLRSDDWFRKLERPK
ncbi:hypothetical protein IDSA_08940 [Pseudidiomarina salinarum]|uniref:ApeA N-terminal domain-containing protein n=1 Tax=Pseudidiomarina salinarum TaxID=435908 RepID=A0A094L798_9GAMM|nr:hypothetical protein [Pseudidiomarina salinarum]KFZ30648.1 hypothetical protein IDSA_08940 [Pseudidiomarina salinarum]RUO69159.1 hypothetical protein CWI79_09630 [Pseudidiomarina salinarum]